MTATAPSIDLSAHGALLLALVLVAAKLGGEAAVRLRQPAVLGELLAGILLGNLPFAAVAGIGSHPVIDVLAQLGVLVLLFEVGLEETVRDVLAVGASAVRVALLGMLGTLAAVWLVAAWLMPDKSASTHAFFAAALTATSIGITVRVLKDLGVGRSREARTILGAAVVDDILALVLLAIVAGWSGQGGGSLAALLWMIGKTIGFLAAVLVFGGRVGPWLLGLAARMRVGGAQIVAGLVFCLALAGAAQAVGLAPILGAFAAGLVLEASHSAPFVARGEPPLARLLQPLSEFVVPVFFVVMGTRADVRALLRPDTLALVAGAVAAAVLGKLACGLGVARGVSRLAVAAGMLPRGEVSLIFASLGTATLLGGKPVLDATAFSALVAVVVATTLLAPVAVNLGFAQRRRRR